MGRGKTDRFGGGGVTDHGALAGTGDDDHTQYVLVDGTRAMTGDLTVGSDTDRTVTLGRALIDSRATDRAYFSHIDHSDANSYALLQLSTGQVNLNTVSGTLLTLSVANTAHFRVDATNGLRAENAAGPTVLNEASSTTNPTLIPERGVLTKGVGGSDGGDDVSIISNSVESLSVSDASGVRVGKSGGNVGFYATAPVALQTGVAVSAAGIHAALVNLGLITA